MRLDEAKNIENVGEQLRNIHRKERISRTIHWKYSRRKYIVGFYVGDQRIA